MHDFKVLNNRKRFVKVMQQLPPFFILRRLAEAYGVILEPLPVDQQ